MVQDHLRSCNDAEGTYRRINEYCLFDISPTPLLFPKTKACKLNYNIQIIEAYPRRQIKTSSCASNSMKWFSLSMRHYASYSNDWKQSTGVRIKEHYISLSDSRN
mmetsp:Transcript_15853/g.43864  ORF Transcript_15853/g.43864 Transcript_15853/m.43864 type:complete len:105 (+) Transcript_15853:1520-1834(+)